MKKLLSLLLGVFILTACQDSTLTPEHETSQLQEETATPSGEEMPRVVVGSRAELQNLISQLGDPDAPHSRTANDLDVKFSQDDETFVSLLEAKRREIIASLTPEQLAAIENDEEDLEISVSDSIIADIQFAMLLNANREIQVGDTVYRYFRNGVAIAKAENAKELLNVESSINQIVATPDNTGQTMSVTSDITFIPVFNDYAHYEDVYNGDEDSGYGGAVGDVPAPHFHKGITLHNGAFVYYNNITEVDYNGRGDGNWFHFLWGKIWGRNIVACKYFEEGRKLTMNFYDQNYIIYANIGTTLKMQKRTAGIWCDTKATEMEHGWETVIIKYEIPAPMPPETFQYPGMSNPSITTYHPFPFTNESRLLLHIPLVDYDFTTHDLNKAFQTAVTKAYDKASNWVKKQCGSANNMGLMSFEGKEVYIIHGPYYENLYNVKSHTSKFYSKWFPGTFSLTFSLGDSFKIKNLKISTNDGVELYRGCVYGAIKYNGKWCAARIYKYD